MNDRWLLGREDPPIDLVLTDLIMPDMGGRELAAYVRAHRPALPVLYTSGYSKDIGGSQEALANAEHFLPKPFGPMDLACKVREVLGTTNATPRIGGRGRRRVHEISVSLHEGWHRGRIRLPLRECGQSR